MSSCSYFSFHILLLRQYQQSDRYHYYNTLDNQYPTTQGYGRFDQWSNQRPRHHETYSNVNDSKQDYNKNINNVNTMTAAYSKPNVFYKSSTASKATFTVVSTIEYKNASLNRERYRSLRSKPEKEEQSDKLNKSIKPKRRKLNTPPIRQSSRSKMKTLQSNNSVEELSESLKNLSSKNFSKENSALSLLNDICSSSTDDELLPLSSFVKNSKSNSNPPVTSQEILKNKETTAKSSSKSPAKTIVTSYPKTILSKIITSTINNPPTVNSHPTTNSSLTTNSQLATNSQINQVVTTSFLANKFKNVSDLLKSVRPVLVKISKVSEPKMPSTDASAANKDTPSENSCTNDKVEQYDILLLPMLRAILPNKLLIYFLVILF